MGRSIVQGSLLTVALVTGVAMIATATLLQSPPVTSPTMGDAAAAHRFYAGVNAVIATGDTSLLHAVVAPYFVERAPLPGEGSGRSGLEAYLAMLHSIDSGLRLVTEDVATDGELTVVRVSVAHGSASPIVAETTVDLPQPWSPVDVIRVSDGLIVERWSQTDGIGLVRPLAQVSLDLSAPAPRVVTIDRLTLLTGAQWTARASGPHLLFLEAGAVHIGANEERSGAPALPPSSPRPSLSAGQSLLMPAGVAFELTNVGIGEARVVVVTLAVPQAPGGNRVGDVVSTGTAVQRLAGGMATQVGLGPVDLNLEQVFLAPGAQLSFSRDDGPTLIAVDAGQLGVISSEPAWIRSGVDGVGRQAHEARLAPGDGEVLGAAGVTVVQNRGDDPVVALVFTVRATPPPGQRRPPMMSPAA